MGARLGRSWRGPAPVRAGGVRTGLAGGSAGPGRPRAERRAVAGPVRVRRLGHAIVADHETWLTSDKLDSFLRIFFSDAFYFPLMNHGPFQSI